MEILIPGLILVALMVWLSTRIKRNAAAAFDAETVETDEFFVRKPEGFLHVLNDASGFVFRAYSKDHGTADHADWRQATIEIERHRNTDIDSVRRGIEAEASKLEAEEPYQDGGERALILNTRVHHGEAEYEISRKLVTRGRDVYELRVSVLEGHQEGFSQRAEEIIGGVRFK